jgi:hypothetical protein
LIPAVKATSYDWVAEYFPAAAFPESAIMIQKQFKMNGFCRYRLMGRVDGNLFRHRRWDRRFWLLHFLACSRIIGGLKTSIINLELLVQFFLPGREELRKGSSHSRRPLVSH